MEPTKKGRLLLNGVIGTIQEETPGINATDGYAQAAAYLAATIAMLTSTIKQEREDAKALVRQFVKTGLNNE